MLLQYLRRNAVANPDDTAIVFGGERVSHRGLLTRVLDDGMTLRAQGVCSGDTVVLLVENSPAYVSCFYAVAACGGVNVPLNTSYKEDELKLCVIDCGATAIVVDKARAAMARRVADSLDWKVSVVLVDDALRGLLRTRLSDRDEGDEEGEEAAERGGELTLDADVVHIYSSGSTGRPKRVPRTMQQYVWEAESVCKALNVTRDDVIYCSIPLFHNLGAVHCMLAATVSAALLVILDRTKPFAFQRHHMLNSLESERATILPTVPYVLEQLSAVESSVDLSSLRLCYSAGAALDSATAETFYAKHGVPIHQHYGCSEVGAMTIDLEGAAHVASGCVGRPFPGVTIRIVDDNGEELRHGTVGEIVASARQMTRGYLNEPEANHSSFRNGEFYTGDLGQLDDSGRLYLAGRKKSIIDVAGQKVTPGEVEHALEGHPCVAGAVVIGVAGPAGAGQVVKAYVQLKASASKEELFVYCRQRLAFFKVPRQIEFISALPKDDLGKIQRRADVLDRLIVES